MQQRFERAGQGHVFDHFGDLDDAARRRLLDQAGTIDLEELAGLVETHVRGDGGAHADTAGVEPAPYIPLPSNGGDAALWQRATEAGESAIRAGRVAAFTVAGGQGTRLGYDGPKGTYPVTPVTSKTLFEVFAGKIARTGERYGVDLHWFILTSEINNAATVEAFEAAGYFGLPKESVHFIVQGLMPAVGYDGRILMAGRDRIAMTPDGHGGALRALARSGAVDVMEDLGIEALSYFQVDNPLVRCVDPPFVGFHFLNDSELSSKMTPKAYPLEKVGHFCSRGGRLEVIEYSDMPAAMQEETGPDGRLRFLAGSIAIHVFDRAFIKRVGSGEEAAFKLPFHRADKKIPALTEDGSVVKPDTPNGVKFEMFVFDALPLASNPVIIETARADDFSPVKNAEGLDSPATCRDDQLRMFSRWLASAGDPVETDDSGLPPFRFEIASRFAADERDFVERWTALADKPVVEEGTVIQ